MKPQELKQEELQAINGGADSSANTGTGLTLGTGSLLSLGYSYNDGQGRSYQSTLEIGKDIHIGTLALGNNQQQ